MRRSTESAILFALVLSLSSQPLSAQQQTHDGKATMPETKSTLCCNKMRGNYWYLGGEFFSPFFFGDLYSVTPDKTSFGFGGQLKVGYQFSPVFALELNGGYGQNSAFPLAYQYDYMLGIRDAYTYYPYTMIDGVTYTTVKELFGEQGTHTLSASLEGIGFDKIQSNIRLFQSSLNAVFNLNRLFSLSAVQGEQPLVLLLKPGLYLSRFESTIVNKSNGQRVAPKVNRNLTLGAGGDLTLRYNASQNWAFELTNRFIWERDRAIDGVLSAKRAYDDYVWQPAVSVVYKFARKAKQTEPAIPVVPPTPIEQPRKIAEMPEFKVSYPKADTQVVPKQRTHVAAISLTYPLNKTYVDPGLANNEAELARIHNELQQYISNPDVTVSRIVIEGFASPEGSLQNNLRLAEGRAASLIEYVRKRAELPASLFSLGKTEENWKGLQEAIEKSNLANKPEILNILSEPNTEVRKEAMKKLPNYRELLDELYPSLRLSKYTGEYRIRGFNPLEAKERIKNNPESLNAEEIYAVALLAPEGSQEFQETLRLLHSLYPASDIALLTKGIEAIQAKKYEEAALRMEQIRNKTANVYNALAVAYIHTNDIEQALKYLALSEREDADARSNLEKLNNYLSELKK